MKRYILLILFVLVSCVPNTISIYKPQNKPPHKSILARRHIITHVTITCYQPLVSQCDDSPLVTSDGSKINLKDLKVEKIKWCAISQDLLYLFPKNKPKIIWVEGYGEYEVKDVMNRRHKHKLDLLIHPDNSMRINLKNVKIKIYT